MNSSLQKHLNAIFSLDYIDVCLAGCMNIFLILAIFVGRNKIFYGAFLSIGLVATITMLLMILVERIASSIRTREENKNLIIAILLETFLLFGLPLLPPTTNLFFLILQLLAVVAVQSSATLFFWKACESELSKAFVSATIAGTVISEDFPQVLSLVSSKIKIQREKLARHIYVPSPLLVKKIRAPDHTT
ncbi:MAG: hypothetical protein PHV42_00265 [Candidatus Pacebacteria bacterium]|nr:hypothetical protein [Candidatus Paceibacterota bacterium]